MDLEDEADSRKKLVEQQRKLQKELRDIEKFSCVPKEFQEALRVTCRNSCKKWNKGSTISCQNIRKCRRGRQKMQSIQDKGRTLPKDSTAAEEEMRKLQEELQHKEERVLFLSNKIDNNKIQDAEMAAELQSLQAGK